MTRESAILYEHLGHYVTKERQGYVVWRHKGTHAVSDSTYHATPDGLSIAKARTDYLAKRDELRNEITNNGDT